MTNGTVVILGRTGRNFAAGMSGGIAYVFDDDGGFVQTRCNKAGVDIEPLFDTEDLALLERLIRRHVEYTGSPRGRAILQNWPSASAKFVKVFPHEYKRALGIPRIAVTAKMPVPASPAKQKSLVQEGVR